MTETATIHDSPKGSDMGHFVLVWIIVFSLLFAVVGSVIGIPQGIREFASSISPSNWVSFSLVSQANDAINTPQTGGISGATAGETAASNAAGIPIGLSIAKIGLNASIQNPTSTKTSVLDTALEKGVVRYPGSATLSNTGTMFLFGHSSELPVVHNQNYRVFNKLKDLKLGDEILVNSKDRVAVYKVTSVSLVTDDASVVEFQKSTKKLVLSTCDVFGKKAERFVVTADFVGSHSVKTF